MTDQAEQEPPFLKDLTEDVELRATTLRKPVHGREIVTKLIRAVGSLYTSRTPRFHASMGDRELLQYEALMKTGGTIHGTVVVTRDTNGGVTHLSITHAPLDEALALSAALGEAIQPDLDRALFLR